jgi:hypothetical protein
MNEYTVVMVFVSSILTLQLKYKIMKEIITTDIEWKVTRKIVQTTNTKKLK